MIELLLTPEDLSLIRFGFSPVRETVASLRILATASENGPFGPWLRQVRPLLGGVTDLELLTTLVRPVGYIPDFLVPEPLDRSSGFRAGLAGVAAADPEIAAEQLLHLADHRLAQQGPGRDRRVRLLRNLADKPATAIQHVVRALEAYWQVAIEPSWPRIRTLHQDDLNYRLAELATGGVQQLFRTLHPQVAFHRDRLRITKYYNGQVDLRRRGLRLVPCAFAWPDVLVRTVDPDAVTVSYAPRGLARLWERAPQTHRSPLDDVLGRTRASILALLDVPMSTTQLAGQLDLTPATLSVHVKALRAAGLLNARREGRSVLYSRTELGAKLLAAAR